MNCDQAIESIPLYYYGELPPEDEERLEQHVDGCPACRAELGRQRRMAAALDAGQVNVPAGLLAECRHDLMRAVYREEAPVRAYPGRRMGLVPRRIFGSVRSDSRVGGSRLGAVALLALGWFSARLTTAPKPLSEMAMPAQDVVYSSIRSVQPDAAGRVQIALDETRRRTVSGRLDDDNIRRLLLAAVREQDNPAVRVESVGLLRTDAVGPDVRPVLLSAALHDPSAAVRLKAVEGLKAIAGDPDVRKTLSQVLLTDENPGVRIRTIDLLMRAPRRLHGRGAPGRGAEGEQQLRAPAMRAGAEGHERVCRHVLTAYNGILCGVVR